MSADNIKASLRISNYDGDENSRAIEEKVEIAFCMYHDGFSF